MGIDVISLTRKLLTFNNTNPPGNEKEIAVFSGELLKNHGFRAEYYYYGENRLNLVAERGLCSEIPPIVLSGHFDTVPLGNMPWSVNPFGGEIKDGKIWGRGSSDMKGGVAALITASVNAFEESVAPGGVRLIFSAAEELGCQGITDLVSTHKIGGEASAVIVAEPTANLPVTGHKGALYLNAVFSGRTAHSSMPDLGDNAIYKAARAVLNIRDFDFEAERDPLLGFPTINVGMISGGMNINSVPDVAEFTIDVRSTTKVDHKSILERLKKDMEGEAVFEVLTDLAPVYTPEEEPFIQLVYNICGVGQSAEEYPKALPYLTDGAVLQRHYQNAPTVILGPGQPEMAHQTDEFCYLNNLKKAVRIYKEIMIKWNRK